MARKSSGRTPKQNIDVSGRKIYEKGDQITLLSHNRCDVKSQSTEGATYKVWYGCNKFTCECPYHVNGKGRRCKHIAAVEYMLLQKAGSSHAGKMIINKVNLKCTMCGSCKYVKNGKDKCKSGEKQRVSVQVL